MKVEPIGNRVLIKPKSPEEKSKGGILLAKKEEEKQDQGEVISVGDGAGVKRFIIGDVLIFQKYGPAEIIVDKEKYVIVHTDEILGRII